MVPGDYKPGYCSACGARYGNDTHMCQPVYSSGGYEKPKPKVKKKRPAFQPPDWVTKRARAW